MTEEGKERCEYCGEYFKNLSRHKCKVKELTDEADAKKFQEIEVPASATKSLIPDRFWAWTEGFGIQMGSLIGLSEDIKNNLGNLWAFLREQLTALNSGMADMIELLQEVVNYEKLRLEFLKQSEKKISEILEEEVPAEAPKEKIRRVSPGFETAKPEKEITSYKEDSNLPEHTRKLKGTINIMTPKALLINFTTGVAAWIPKSTIHEDYIEEKDVEQEFIIDSWVLIKNEVIEEEK